MTPLNVWANRRPLVYQLVERPPWPARFKRVAWAFYWNVLLRLRYWAWYPVVNPRLTYIICMVVAAVTIGITRSRS